MFDGNFSKHLTVFLTEHLPLTRNVSKNTIASYCDSFRLLLIYLNDDLAVKPERIKLSMVTDKVITDFLKWLETTRGSGISTCNQRLAAIHSFFRYIQFEDPQSLLICQKILNIPFKKKDKPMVSYLNVEDMKAILMQPNIATQAGRRDLTIISLMYDTGARVQELADLCVRDVHLLANSYLTLTGKGRKTRAVPLLENTSQLLKSYLGECKLLTSDKLDYPLFVNRQKKQLTRAGIAYILKKYTDEARETSNTIPDKVTPHTLRHTKAMHLAEANVNPIYIRDILGHADISTVGIYVNSSMKMKREALEKSIKVQAEEVPSWANDTSTIEWLKNYGKKIM